MEISVIMGVYNPVRPEHLIQAVQSIVRQSFPHWEMLLYDDGSGPNYAGAIQAAAKLDSRIRYLRGEENRGLAHALNQCIAHARGKYLARMDADDIAWPERFARQHQFLETHPQYQWVGSTARLMDESGIWGLETVAEIPEARDFLSHSPYIHPTVLFRRGALGEGYREAGRFRLCEDYELFMRLHQQGGRGYNLQTPLLDYRQDAGAYKKRTLGRRLRETGLRYQGFRALGILRPGTFPYVLKPLAVAAIPGPIQHVIAQRRKGKPWIG